ncbi:MAG: BrnT family toxin [Elusimicrobia bacterium]|nr:BrnT family toxin [Elusimicrobiota bacterium]
MQYRFEWDPKKNRLNQRRHGVSFEDAATAFADDNGRYIPDKDHSNGEERFILLGMSAKLRILIVCYCYRQSESVIRIISARRAMPRERAQYERFLS